jgi:hypothetical protein
LHWMVEGRCGFATDFDFRSGDGSAAGLSCEGF